MGRGQSSVLAGFGGDESILSDMITDIRSLRDLFPGAWQTAVAVGTPAGSLSAERSGAHAPRFVDGSPEDAGGMRPRDWQMARTRLGALDTAVGTARLQASRPAAGSGSSMGCHSVPYLRSDAGGESLRRSASETEVAQLTQGAAFAKERVADSQEDAFDECSRLNRTHGRPSQVLLSSNGYTPSKLTGSINAEGKTVDALIPASFHWGRMNKSLALVGLIRGMNGEDRWTSTADGDASSKSLQERSTKWVEALVTADFEPVGSFIDETVYLLGGEPSHTLARHEQEVGIDINMGRGGHPQSHPGFEADLRKALPRLEGLMARAYGSIDATVVGGGQNASRRRFGLAIHDSDPTDPSLMRTCAALHLSGKLHVLRFVLQELRRAFYDFRHSKAGLPDVTGCIRNATLLVPGLKAQSMSGAQVAAQVEARLPAMVQAQVDTLLPHIVSALAAADKRKGAPAPAPTPAAPALAQKTNRGKGKLPAEAGGSTPAPAPAPAPTAAVIASPPAAAPTAASLSPEQLAQAKAKAQEAANQFTKTVSFAADGTMAPDGQKNTPRRADVPEWIVALKKGQNLATVKIPSEAIGGAREAKVAFNALFLLARGEDPNVEPHPPYLPCFTELCMGGCEMAKKGKCKKCEKKAQWEPVPPAVTKKVKDNAAPAVASRIKDG